MFSNYDHPPGKIAEENKGNLPILAIFPKEILKLYYPQIIHETTIESSSKQPLNSPETPSVFIRQ